jgi:hypothetical protein
MIQNKDARCLTLYGCRGSGKSTRAKTLLKEYPRVVAFDPMAEYAKDKSLGFRRADTIKDVRDLLKANWAKPFKISYVPSGDFVSRLHHLSELIWHVQKPYDDGRDNRKILLLIEEANMGYPNQKLPPHLTGAQRLVLQGRHRGVEIMGITQRPALVSADFRGNVDEVYIFKQSQPLDIAAITGVIGKEHEAAIRALDTHEYLHWNRGVVTKGKNKLRKTA